MEPVNAGDDGDGLPAPSTCGCDTEQEFGHYFLDDPGPCPRVMQFLGGAQGDLGSEEPYEVV